MIRAVLFDMDEVLADSESLMREAICAMFAERHGIVVELSDIEPFVGGGEDATIAGIAARHGIEIDLASDRERMFAIYDDIIHGRLKEVRGATAFARQCRDAGLKTAIVSSADPHKIKANLKEMSMPEALFDAIVAGSEVARRKPWPDPYLEAARRLGLEPAECMVFEDALNGIKSSLAAGCPCIAIEGSFPAEALLSAGALRVLRDFTKLNPSQLGIPQQKKPSGKATATKTAVRKKG